LNDLLCAGYAAEPGPGNCEAGAEGRHGWQHLESEGRALLVRSEETLGALGSSNPWPCRRWPIPKRGRARTGARTPS
jgi:hypothetical protein